MTMPKYLPAALTTLVGPGLTSMSWDDAAALSCVTPAQDMTPLISQQVDEFLEIEKRRVDSFMRAALAADKMRAAFASVKP